MFVHLHIVKIAFIMFCLLNNPATSYTVEGLCQDHIGQHIPLYVLTVTP